MRGGLSRSVARRLLTAVRVRDAWLSALVHQAVRDAGLRQDDASFAMRIAYGVVASRGTLDEALDRHLTSPGRVHPAVRDVLRIAAYELLFMRTPDYAAVNEAVAAVRGLQPSAAGMANAVLRKVAREATTFPWGDPASDVTALARSAGVPVWMARRITTDRGWDAAIQMLNAQAEPAPVFVAHNPFAGSFEALIAELTAAGAEPAIGDLSGCLRLGSPAFGLRSDALARGRCVVSDAAAQLVAALAAPDPGGVVVDCAAGRGTKTALMQIAAVRAGGVGRVTAADIHPFKLAVLEARMRELGVPGVVPVLADTADLKAVASLGGVESADVVLVDVPCTNLGTLRRHPERVWGADPKEADTFADLAPRMLDVASRLVRPGGFMVYSTCTVTHRENEFVVEEFLASRGGQGFTRDTVLDRVPAEWRMWVTSDGWLQTLPRIGGPDGHFAALLRRR